MATLREVTRADRARPFWWDRARPVHVDVHPLRAVIFDLDSAMADIDSDGDPVARAGLVDSVMSLFVAGVWVGVVSTKTRTAAEPLVRQLLGDGLVQTIVTADDLPDSSVSTRELYKLALWEFGIRPQCGLAVVGDGASLRAAADCGLATVAVPVNGGFGVKLRAAAAIRPGFDGTAPLLVSEYQRVHRRWWATSRSAA